MPALSKTEAQLEVRAMEGLRAFLAQVTGLTTVDWRRADDPRERPLPLAVVLVTNLKESWAGSDEFEGVLQVGYESGKDPDGDSDGLAAEEADVVANQAAHVAIVAKISNALMDQSAMRAFLNSGGTSRPVTDFHFYGLFEHEEPGTERVGNSWSTIFRRRIVVARIDYAA